MYSNMRPLDCFNDDYGALSDPRYFPVTPEEYEKLTNEETDGGRIDPKQKEVTCTENCVKIIEPSGDFDGLSSVKVTVDVPQKTVKEDAVELSATENGTVDVLAADYDVDGLKSVKVTVDVAGGGGGDSRLAELYLSDDAVEVETYDTNKAFVFVNADYVEDCDIYAVIWGDGTYTETDGTTITNGDSKKTRMEAFSDSDGTNYYLMHTYDETKSYNIKVNGTYFYATFYIFDTKSSDFPAYVKSLYIDKGVKTLTTYVTAYQSELAHITFNSECTTALGNYCFSYGGGGINNVFIPDGVTLAGEGQFWNTVVSNFQFGRSNKLTQIPAYFNYGQIDWHDWNFLPKLEIPEGVTFIGASAFAANSIYIGDTIVDLKLPSTLQTIDMSAFHCMMANGAVVDIPSSVTSIGKNAFFRPLCQGSESTPDGKTTYTVICRCTTLPTLGEQVFYGADYTKPTHCTLYVPNSVIDLYKNAEQWKEFGKILPIESMGLGIATNE